MQQMSSLTTTNGNDQFYPTPDGLAGKMLAGLDWNYIYTVLEPSAGKGNLVLAAGKASYNGRRNGKLDVDCIEIDPFLRQILKYNLSAEAIKDKRERWRELDRKSYSDRTDAENGEMRRLKDQMSAHEHVQLHIVHDDFLTFRARKRYDLILMNPPFANGDQHLLKALEIQQGGGAIVCLLNAETLLNPFTNSRKLLKKQLAKYEAKVTFCDGEFTNAERKTDVRTAIVRIDIPRAAQESTIYERMKQAEEARFDEMPITDLVAGDYIERMIQHYNVEVEATLDFIREYHALCPYMTRGLSSDDTRGSLDRDPILTLVIERGSAYDTFDVNKYMQKVRLKYWTALFHHKEFMDKLTSNLCEKYISMVDKMADYEFSAFNIQQIIEEMNSELIGGVKETIIALFDKLTAEHSWYPESKQNIHYYNGWRTNLAHKVGKKAIIPTHGMFSSYSWNKETFCVSTAYKVISDIEKAFNYLDGGRTQEVDLMSRLQTAEKEGCTRNIECKYFSIDIYKKGTTHIKFTDMDLVQKLNIYAARNKNWLPPSYGRAPYAEMTSEDKSVVDSFQGAAEYSRVMTMAGYFLAEPTKSMMMLTE